MRHSPFLCENLGPLLLDKLYLNAEIAMVALLGFMLV